MTGMCFLSVYTWQTNAEQAAAKEIVSVIQEIYKKEKQHMKEI